MKQVQDINTKYPKINYGACGTFSYHLSSLLSKYGINNQIVYNKEEYVPTGAFRCDVKFTHIMVKTDYCLIDNNDTYPLNNKLLILDKDYLGYMITEPRLWNNVFDWDKRNDLATDILNIKL